VPESELPMVSLHVPAHNEPPDMVIETLRSLLRLDYPRYEVILFAKKDQGLFFGHGCDIIPKPGIVVQ
jgi:cellulose synthase/poly-beta-1,6-N-acetylglucosamine synthase-like glycosyltransferase